MNLKPGKRFPRFGFLAALALLLAGAGLGAAEFFPQSTSQDPVNKRLSAQLRTTQGEDEQEKPNGFLITGMTEQELKAIADAEFTNIQMRELVGVRVDHGNRLQDRPPLAGTFEFDGDGIIFTPRYAPMRGVTYEITFNPALLPESVRPERPEHAVLNIEVPRLDAAPARVEQVFPSGEVLPENLLKFYLHFSAPMSVGDSYRHVKLFEIRDGAEPREIELPFLTLEQELWNDNGSRLTLLFDPGRIKRGLRPREEVGPALEEGKTYEFVVSGGWRDARGVPLAEEHRKRFRVAAPDDEQPKPAEWDITPPEAGARGPLTVLFSEPLDQAMLNRVIRVVKKQPGNETNANAANTSVEGDVIAGEISIEANETRWMFIPDDPWVVGEYELIIETTLEDRSGNSIGRPFEVDIFNEVDRQVAPEYVKRTFHVRAF